MMAKTDRKEKNNDSQSPFGNMLSMVDITDHEFNRISEIIYDNFGIRLSHKKKMLVAGRLQKYLREAEFKSFFEYISYIENDKSGNALSALINHISTNHTFFFREQEHYNFLNETILPGIEERLKNQRVKDIRIWSAGCSGGDEAYSFAICLMEYFRDNYILWDAGVLATDISEKKLDEARAGLYLKKRITFVSDIYMSRYFNENDDDRFKVNECLKKEVTFRRLNLTNKHFNFKKKFDLISCRNVMIYFDNEIRDRLVRNLYDLTLPGGYLFVGHSESLNSKKYLYNYVKPGIYQKGSSDGLSHNSCKTGRL